MRLILLSLLLFSGPALAVGTLDPALASDGLLRLIEGTASRWNTALRGYATEIFTTLALIQFVWKFGLMAIRRTEFDEVAAELVRWITIMGIYLALLLYSVGWIQEIIDIFRQAGAAASGMGGKLQPGDLFKLAVELGRTVASIGLTDPITSFVVALSAVLIVMCFTFLAAFLMVTLVESYFIINAGVFFMAFGGSEWTREYAVAMLRYAVSIGAKLLVLQLLVGLIMESARTWQAAYTHDETSMFTMVGISLIAAYFCKTLAETVQALINGVSVGGGSTLGAMTAAGMAGVAAGAAAMSATMGNSMLGGGGKGVADLIKSSVSSVGGGPGGGSSSPGSFMNSGGGSGGGSGRSSGPSPRTGGGGYSQAPSAPPSQQSSAGNQSANGGSSQSSAQTSSQSVASSTAAKIHAGAHMATNAVLSGASVMGNLAVPGMENTSASIGPPPTQPELSDIPGLTPENVIRPESPVPSAGPAEAPEAQPVDTMSSVQEALNNRGKPS